MVQAFTLLRSGGGLSQRLSSQNFAWVETFLLLLSTTMFTFSQPLVLFHNDVIWWAIFTFYNQCSLVKGQIAQSAGTVETPTASLQKAKNSPTDFRDMTH